MLSTVSIYDQLSIQTNKIDNKPSHRLLTSELHPVELLESQMPP